MNRHAGKRALSIIAAGLLGAAMAAAQQPGMGGAPQNPTPGQSAQPGQPNTPGYPGYTPGASAGATGTTGSMSRSFADQEFITRTLANSSAEAQMSQLATQKSQSPDVKQYGQRMVKIHTQLAQQLKPVAQMLGVSSKQKPSKKQRKEIAQLKTLNGSQFDQAYIKDMAKDQKHDVKSFKDEEIAAQNPAIKKAAKLDEPVLSQHLQILEELAQNHSVTIASR